VPVRKKVALALLISTIILLSIRCTQASEYFPFQQGSSKEYRTETRQGNQKIVALIKKSVLPKRSIDGQVVTVLKSVMSTIERSGESFTSYTFYAENDDGLRRVAFQSPDETTPRKLKKEEWQFKYPLTVGTSWVNYFEIPISKETVSVPILHTIEKMNDVVTVEAGTFRNCMKIRGYFKGNVTLPSHGGKAEMTIEAHNWYAPGVGNVKSWFHEKSNKLDWDFENLTQLKIIREMRCSLLQPFTKDWPTSQ
jgi:hypothetical protein